MRVHLALLMIALVSLYLVKGPRFKRKIRHYRIEQQYFEPSGYSSENKDDEEYVLLALGLSFACLV